MAGAAEGVPSDVWPSDVWPSERVVVVSDDPWSVEGAVVQLEAWGAQPAVMFERTRALQALSVTEPDLVVLDFGRDPRTARSVLGGLEEMAPVLPGAAHGAPVVALAEGPIAPRLERDAWAPMHVVGHDDPAAVRAALLAALEEATAFGEANAEAAAVAPARVAAATAQVARRSLAPLAAASAAALGLAGLGVVALVRMRAEAPGPAGPPQGAAPSRVTTGPSSGGGGAPTTAGSLTPSVAPNPPPASVAAVVPTTVPAASPSALPSTVPTVPAGAPTSAPTTAPSVAPTVASTPASPSASTIPAGEPSNAVSSVASPFGTAARFPVTGSR